MNEPISWDAEADRAEDRCAHVNEAIKKGLKRGDTGGFGAGGFGHTNKQSKHGVAHGHGKMSKHKGGDSSDRDTSPDNRSGAGSTGTGTGVRGRPMLAKLETCPTGVIQFGATPHVGQIATPGGDLHRLGKLNSDGEIAPSPRWQKTEINNSFCGGTPRNANANALQ